MPEVRTALVTGAASGIGAGLVAELVERGVRVWAADRDPAVLDAHAGHDAVHPVVLDVTDADAVRATMEGIVAEHGRLDYVFNNAGILTAGPMEAIDDDSWQRAVDVNLWGVVHGTRIAYDLMRAQGFGHIVNTASSAGALPVAGSVPYAMTKPAVVGLSTSLRAEAARTRTGVRVSVVLPGLVDTAVGDNADASGGYDYARAMSKVPFKSISPRQAAAAILKGVDDNRAEIAFPRYNKVLIGLYRRMPERMGMVVNQNYRPAR